MHECVLATFISNCFSSKRNWNGIILYCYCRHVLLLLLLLYSVCVCVGKRTTIRLFQKFKTHVPAAETPISAVWYSVLYIQKWDGLANDKKKNNNNKIYSPRLFRTTTLSGLVIQVATDEHLLQWVLFIRNWNDMVNIYI